jgi:hypothetical protein
MDSEHFSAILFCCRLHFILGAELVAECMVEPGMDSILSFIVQFKQECLRTWMQVAWNVFRHASVIEQNS